MPRRDALDTKLRQLALKVVEDALEGRIDDDHKARLDALKAAGNYATASIRAKKGVDDVDDDESMVGIKNRIRAADKHPGGHA